MNRLTHLDHLGWYLGKEGEHPALRQRGTAVDCLAAYEDTGYTPEDFDWLCREMSAIRKALGVATYEQLRDMVQDGRLLVLPCAIGSTVYIIGHKYRAGWDECWINPGKFRPSDLEKIGERVFLTYEDAEAKILAMNKGNPRFRFIERGGSDGK